MAGCIPTPQCQPSSVQPKLAHPFEFFSRASYLSHINAALRHHPRHHHRTVAISAAGGVQPPPSSQRFSRISSINRQPSITLHQQQNSHPNTGNINTSCAVGIPTPSTTTSSSTGSTRTTTTTSVSAPREEVASVTTLPIAAIQTNAFRCRSSAINAHHSSSSYSSTTKVNSRSLSSTTKYLAPSSLLPHSQHVLHSQPLSDARFIRSKQLDSLLLPLERTICHPSTTAAMSPQSLASHHSAHQLPLPVVHSSMAEQAGACQNSPPRPYTVRPMDCQTLFGTNRPPSSSSCATATSLANMATTITANAGSGKSHCSSHSVTTNTAATSHPGNIKLKGIDANSPIPPSPFISLPAFTSVRQTRKLVQPQPQHYSSSSAEDLQAPTMGYDRSNNTNLNTLSSSSSTGNYNRGTITSMSSDSFQSKSRTTAAVAPALRLLDSHPSDKYVSQPPPPNPPNSKKVSEESLDSRFSLPSTSAARHRGGCCRCNDDDDNNSTNNNKDAARVDIDGPVNPPHNIQHNEDDDEYSRDTTPGQGSPVSSSVLSLGASTPSSALSSVEEGVKSQKTVPRNFPMAIPPDNTLIILDYDDTLLPTNWVAVQNRIGLSDTVPLHTKAHLNELSEFALQTIEFCKSHGKLIVVTNASTEWVTRSGEKFIPAVFEMLQCQGIEIISARDQLQNSGMAQKQWKMQVFEETITKHFGDRHSAGVGCSVISIGDGEGEREACLQMRRIFRVSAWKFKSLKLLTTPTCNQLISEHLLIQQAFPEILKVRQDLDMMIFHYNSYRTRVAEETSPPIPPSHTTAAAATRTARDSAPTPPKSSCSAAGKPFSSYAPSLGEAEASPTTERNLPSRRTSVRFPEKDLRETKAAGGAISSFSCCPPSSASPCEEETENENGTDRFINLISEQLRKEKQHKSNANSSPPGSSSSNNSTTTTNSNSHTSASNPCKTDHSLPTTSMMTPFGSNGSKFHAGGVRHGNDALRDRRSQRCSSDLISAATRPIHPEVIENVRSQTAK